MGTVHLFDESTDQGPREAYRIGLGVAWNLMSERNRKAILIIAGMTAALQKNGDYAAQPNACFYSRQPWHVLPFEWQSRIYGFLIQMKRGGS